MKDMLLLINDIFLPIVADKDIVNINHQIDTSLEQNADKTQSSQLYYESCQTPEFCVEVKESFEP